MAFTRVVRDDDRLSVVNGSSWLGWVTFGIAAVAGLFAAIGAVRSWSDPRAAAGAPAALAVAGAGVVLLGVIVLTLAHVTVVDRRNETVRTGWMTLGCWLSRRWPFAAIRGVTVTAGRAPTGGGSVPRHRVHLVGTTVDHVVAAYVTEYPTGEAARSLAAELAAFGGWALFEEP